MNATDPIKTAKEIIGQGQEDDYILDPSGHAEQFAEKAPALAGVLGSSDTRATAAEFKHWDSQAIQAQSEFRKWSSRARWAVFLTACFSAGLLATGTILARDDPDGVADCIVRLFASGSVLCGAFAGACINRIRSGGLLEKWMTKRAEAETYRLQYFDVIVRDRPETSTASTVPLALLQLEYFRRFQVDVQLAFYRLRAQQHSDSANRALSLSTWAMLGVAAVNGLALVLGVRWAAVAGVALIIQAFASKVTNTEAVNQDGRNAERYERTRSVLAKLSGKVDRVRRGILEGSKEVLPSFVQAVHEQLSLEHRQWLEAADERLSAIGQLERHLKELKQDTE